MLNPTFNFSSTFTSEEMFLHRRKENTTNIYVSTFVPIAMLSSLCCQKITATIQC